MYLISEKKKRIYLDLFYKWNFQTSSEKLKTRGRVLPLNFRKVSTCLLK